MRKISKILIISTLLVVTTFYTIGCGSATAPANNEVPIEQFDTSILKKGASFNWESFTASGQHHNGGVFEITNKIGNYLEVTQTCELGAAEVSFIGAIVSKNVSEGNVNFILINPKYHEVWLCTYVDEHTISGTVLDGTFTLTY